MIPRTPHRLARAALLLATAALVSGCADPGPKNIPTVSGEFGKRPTVVMPKLPAPKQARMTVLKEGDGPVTRKGQVIVTDVDMRLWESGKPLMDTYRLEQPTTAVLDGKHVARTWDQSLIGRKAGSRVLLVSPATHGFGPNGMAPAQVKPSDHMVLVFDVIGGYDPKQQVSGGSSASGAASAHPAVSVRPGQEPVLSDWGPAPKKFAARTLVAGTGPELKPGQRMVVQFSGVEWGKKGSFNSTYRRSGPNGFLLKDRALLPGWYEGLTGRRVGSRVLLTVPAGHRPGFTHTDGGLAAPKNRPVAYVVDILDAR
ncbi:FKBP-type peptidyl-prolyl cis-trans isomerase [Actinomycetota bacterium Odt1-20B]